MTSSLLTRMVTKVGIAWPMAPMRSAYYFAVAGSWLAAVKIVPTWRVQRMGAAVIVEWTSSVQRSAMLATS